MVGGGGAVGCVVLAKAFAKPSWEMFLNGLKCIAAHETVAMAASASASVMILFMMMPPRG